MGDRGNIVVIDEGQRVYLYGHWSGYQLPSIVRSALERGQDRWDDPPYLARIIFAEMTKGDETGTSGYGISTKIGDNEYPLLLVDCDKQTVTIEEEPNRSYIHGEIKSYSFANYIKLVEPDWDVLDGGRKADED